MNKFLCLAIVLIVVFSMSGINASADNNLTITFWNADSSMITVDFSAAINQATLANKITLTKEGIAVPFTYALNSVDDTLYPGGSNSETPTPTKNYFSYSIIPTGGLTLESVYNLTIAAGVTSNDGVSMLSIPFTKNFIVHKLFSDNFDNYNTTDNLISSVWNNNMPSNVSMTTENGQMLLSVTADNNRNFIYPTEEDASWRDYTVQAKITMNPGNPLKYYLINMYSCNPLSVTSDAICPNVQFRTRGSTSVAGQSNLSGPNSSTTNNATGYDFLNINRGYKNDEAKVAKFAIKGTSAKFYLDGKQAIEAKTNYYSSGKFGFIAKKTSEPSSSSTYYIDDVIVTKAIEYYDFESIPSNGQNDVLVDSDITIKFPVEIDAATITKENILIEDKNGKLNNYELTLSGDEKTVHIVFENNLNYKTKYTIKVTNVKLKGENREVLFSNSDFYTIRPPFELESFIVLENGIEKNSVSEISGNTFSAKAVIKNNYLTTPQRCVVSIALYNNKQQMCDVKSYVYTLAQGDSVTFDKTFTIDKSNRYFVKCFIWDSFLNMKKLYEESIN